jgi:hypothetical protein
MFKADGAIGGTAQKVGGEFAKDGLIGLVFPFFVPLQLFIILSNGRGGIWEDAAELWGMM